MRLTSLFLSILFISSLQAQQLKPGESAIDFLQVPFNAVFLKNNRIASISIDEQEKRTGLPIKSLNKTKTYYFDSNGQCTEIVTSSQFWGKRDTILEYFGLQAEMAYVRKDQRGLYREQITSSGDTTTVCRYRNDGTSDADTWISCEYTVAIQRTPAMVEYVIHNEEGKPYLSHLYTHNESGYLVEHRERYTISGKESVVTYSYNDQGYVAEKKRTEGATTELWKFSYLPDGTLETVLYYKDANLTWRREMVLDGNGRISAMLTRDEATEAIKIEKFSYSYY